MSPEDKLYRELERNTPYYAEQLRYRRKILSSPSCSHTSLKASTERRGNLKKGHLTPILFSLILVSSALAKRISL